MARTGGRSRPTSAVASFLGPDPNPASGRMTFRLGLPGDANVAVDAYDLAGRQVASLARGRMSPGNHALSWSPRASGLPAGVYFVRARWAGFQSTRRVLLVR